MFTEDERTVILWALWRLKTSITGELRSDIPPEGTLAMMHTFDVIHSAVEKVGGDPSVPLFGLGLPPPQ